MSIDEKLQLITRNAAEVITITDLQRRLKSGERLKGYLGFEPSGLVHVGWIIWMKKFKDLVDADVDMYLLEATWHAWINDKLGGDLDLIRRAAKLTEVVMEAIGIDMNKVKVVTAEELVSDPDYWRLLLKVAKGTTLARMKRALTIMGRKAEEAELDFSKLIYPAMQVTDIFYLGVDIALGGMDQRKAHMLARDVAEKLKLKKPIAIHTPLLTSLQGAGRMDMEKIEVDEFLVEAKMSKSKPETALFVHDSEKDIMRKIRRAYCPPKTSKMNPILEIARYILFSEPRFKLVVEREPKYGGTVVFESYKELEKSYIEGTLHPLDLKNAVAKALVEILKPIRERITGSSELVELITIIEKSTSR